MIFCIYLLNFLVFLCFVYVGFFFCSNMFVHLQFVLNQNKCARQVECEFKSELNDALWAKIPKYINLIISFDRICFLMNTIT